MLDEQGEFAGTLATLADITQQKRSAEWLNRITADARCLLWYAVVEESAGGSLIWETGVANPEAAIDFLRVAQNPDLPLNLAWQAGILPDLFNEGKGAVAQGRLNERGEFVASEVLAKHDENYMPPEAQHAVDVAHRKAKK